MDTTEPKTVTPDADVQVEPPSQSNSLPQATQHPTTTQKSVPQDNYSPSSGVDYVVEGYCNDGTYVKGDPSARGSANACYGHKGWRDY